MPEQTNAADALWESLSPRVEPFSGNPMVFYNHDGDCIELVLSDESFTATRIDPLLTVYIGRESGELVGAVIKGVKAFIQKVLVRAPGFGIEVEDGKIKLEYLFLARLWTAQSPPSGTILRTYRKLRDLAEARDLRADLELEAA